LKNKSNNKDIIQRRGKPESFYKITWGYQTIPFMIVHLIAIIGIFYVSITGKLILLCVLTYYIRMFGISGGYHRYFAHRSYKTSRVFQFLMAFLAQTSSQKGALWWASYHRHHHMYPDQPEDAHSPVQHGFWWGHVGWILSPHHKDTKYQLIKDFAKYPELMFLNKFEFIPTLTLAGLLYVFGGWPALYWGFFLSTTILWHGTFSVNSITHMFGWQRYKTDDTSTNNFWVTALTNGEGWHNNHHHTPWSSRHAHAWWEIDVSFYLLKVLSFFRIVWDLKVYDAGPFAQTKILPARDFSFLDTHKQELNSNPKTKT